MKKLLAILYCVTLFSCVKDKSNPEFDQIVLDNTLDSHLFNTTAFTLNPLTLKTETGYDNVEDSTQYIIASNAIVNNDSLRLMRFAELKQITSDTLELMIFETNPMYSQNLSIKIVDNTFKTEFEYVMSGPPIEPKIKRLKQELIIKSMPKRKRDSIFGRVYFKGICESDCKGDIEIKGDFKATLE